MVNEIAPAFPVQKKGLWPPKNFAAFYYVTDLDDWSTIANKYNVNVTALIEFNFGTQNPREINWYLRELIGCKFTGPDGYNYSFRGADPGKRIIYIPQGASLPAPKPSKPTIYDIYEILDKKIRQGNHRYKVRLKDMLDRLRRGNESGDDRVIQWIYIAPPASRESGILRTVPSGMWLRPSLTFGVSDIWIDKNLKSKSDVDRQPVIRSLSDRMTRFVTSIRWELKAVTSGGNVTDEYYEEKLWFTFTNIYKSAVDSYVWLALWADNSNILQPSTISVGYKAIHKWHQTQALKLTSPIYSMQSKSN